MNKAITSLFVLSVIVFVTQLVFFFRQNYLPFDILYVLLAGFAAISMALAARNASLKVDKRILKLLASGLFLWFIGEFTWMVYEMFLGIKSPFPSWADAFWILGYIPIAYAFYLHRHQLFVARKRKTSFYVISAIFLILSVFVLISGLKDSTALETAISASYLLLDYLIIYGYFFVLLSNKPGELAKPWIILASGFFLFALFDIGFTWFTGTDAYYTGHPIDLLYGLSYLVVTYAVFTRFRAGKIIISSQ